MESRLNCFISINMDFGSNYLKKRKKNSHNSAKAIFQIIKSLIIIFHYCRAIIRKKEY